MADEDDDGGWGDSDGYGVEEAQDDDDTAWKVRKAAVKIIDGLVLSCPSHLKANWAQFVDMCSQRFNERDNNVKCDVLAAFQSLIKASVYLD
jgi:cullin-associated NEDD8-dissociated protein 1